MLKGSHTVVAPTDPPAPAFACSYVFWGVAPICLLYSCNPSPKTLREARPLLGCTNPLLPHAMHVHPLRPIGRTRIVRTSGVLVHSKGHFGSRRVVRSALIYSVDNLDNPRVVRLPCETRGPRQPRPPNHPRHKPLSINKKK